MTITVEHRPDELLQKHKEEGVPDHLEGTFPGDITWPTHFALLTFLDSFVVGVDHADEDALAEVLASWPQFVEEQTDLKLHKEFGEISIDASEGIIYCGESPGGPFVVGLIQQK